MLGLVAFLFGMALCLSGCAEQHYYDSYHHHTQDWYGHHHEPPPPGVNFDVDVHH
jgi:hypothetical protein